MNCTHDDVEEVPDQDEEPLHLSEIKELFGVEERNSEEGNGTEERALEGRKVEIPTCSHCKNASTSIFVCKECKISLCSECHAERVHILIRMTHTYTVTYIFCRIFFCGPSSILISYCKFKISNSAHIFSFFVFEIKIATIETLNDPYYAEKAITILNDAFAVLTDGRRRKLYDKVQSYLRLSQDKI